MRTLPMLLLIAAASPAMAQDGDPIVTGCALANCPAKLEAGQDYMLKAGETNGDGTGGYLIDPAGRTVLFVPYSGDGSANANVRAAYSATYTVKADGTAPVSLYEDCREDDRTRCTISPGSPAEGASTAKFDRDAFRTQLVAGRTYSWTYPEGLKVELLDAAGRTLRANHLGAMQYRPGASGTFYVVASRSAGGSYTITMR